MNGKPCVDCGAYPRYGRYARCGECWRIRTNAQARELQRKKYKENPEYFKAKSSDYYKRNRDRILQERSENPAIREYNRLYMPQYYERNRKKINAQNLANYYANIDSRKARNREYRAANRHKILAQKREYYQANKDVLNAKSAEYIRKNPHISHACRQRRRAFKMGALGKHTEAEWQAIVLSQRHKCAHCGERRKLEKDHRIPLSRGGSDYAYNIQGLCRSCNAKKSNKIEIGDQHSLFDKLDAA